MSLGQQKSNCMNIAQLKVVADEDKKVGEQASEGASSFSVEVKSSGDGANTQQPFRAITLIGCKVLLERGAGQG